MFTIHIEGLSAGDTVYISGPMRGKHCYNFEEFFFWAKILRRSGYDVINPAETDCLRMFEGWVFTDDQWHDVMEKDLEMIRNDAQGLFMLEGWKKSEGATIEHFEAKKLGLVIGCQPEEL